MNDTANLNYCVIIIGLAYLILNTYIFQNLITKMKSLKSLIITTSNNKLGDTLNKNGVWMEDFAAPYYI